MNGSLLDTNVIIKLFKGEPDVVKIFESLEEIFIPVIVLGELYYGAYKSKNTIENIKLFSDFVSEYKILDVDYETSEVYGKIKTDLVSKGINIPENDLWIAAIAVKNDIELITHDRHFININMLKLREIV